MLILSILALNNPHSAEEGKNVTSKELCGGSTLLIVCSRSMHGSAPIDSIRGSNINIPLYAMPLKWQCHEIRFRGDIREISESTVRRLTLQRGVSLCKD